MNTEPEPKAIPEWEEKLGVLLRIYGNYQFDCGISKSERLCCYSEMESAAQDAKEEIIKFVRGLIH